MRHPNQQVSRQQGIALIAVLWVVAALGIMVVGMIHVVKGETRLAAQLQRTTLDSGIADAAIRLALQQTLLANKKEFKTIEATTVQVFDRTVQVEFIPLNGLISLNHAPIALLADAFQYAAGLPKEQATALAQAVDLERQKRNAKGEAAKMHSTEDLLRIPGIDYDLTALVMPLFTTDLEDTQRVNPLAAPLAVLTVLAQGNAGLAQQIFQTRSERGDTTDTTQLNGNHLQISSTGQIAVRATLSSGDNTAVVRVWRLALSGDSHGLPWRVLGQDPPFQISTSSTPP
jgi:general secretion pathway protein K